MSVDIHKHFWYKYNTRAPIIRTIMFNQGLEKDKEKKQKQTFLCLYIDSAIVFVLGAKVNDEEMLRLALFQKL